MTQNEPAPPAVGGEWIEHDGLAMPVPGDTMVNYRVRSGSTWALPQEVLAKALRGWVHSGFSGDIIAYRLVAAPAVEEEGERDPCAPENARDWPDPMTDLDKAVAALTAWIACARFLTTEQIAANVDTLLTALSAKDAELAKAREALGEIQKWAPKMPEGRPVSVDEYALGAIHQIATEALGADQ